MENSTLKTGADDLYELVRLRKKISVEEAAKLLKISTKTAQSLVDFLVEEKIFGIEYKFTTPYIYISQEKEKKIEIKANDSKKIITKSKQGKKNRAAGARFELKVRNNLESEGWIIDKWTNNFDLEEKKLIKAKRKYNPFKKVLGIGTGFPDFIAFRLKKKDYEIIGVEVKGNGWLDKNEKEKCKFLIKKKIFSRILIAKKGKKKGEIEYDNFVEKYGKKYDKT